MFSSRRPSTIRPTRTAIELALRRLLVVAVPFLGACDSGVEPISVGSITLNAVDTRLVVGATVQLSATVLSPSGSVLSGHPVTWSSSHASVASVSPGGMVVALAPGTTTVQARAGGKSGSVTFTVDPGQCDASMTVGSISIGQSHAGTLSPVDCTFFGDRAEGWTFELAATTAFQVVMSSRDFQPILFLTDRHLDVMLWGEPHVGSARLVGELPAGEYIVWVASWDQDPRGAYELSAATVEFCSAATAAATIDIGDVVSGTLRGDDCVFVHGVSAAGYRLNLPGTAAIRVDLSSPDFDALLVVTDLDMNLLSWDYGSGAGTGARIEQRFGPGEYVLWVTGLAGGTAGSYQLSLTETQIPLCPTVGDLGLAQPVSGTLTQSDCVMHGQGFVDPWRLVLTAETTVQLDLTSNQFDTVLLVEDADGGLLAWDDDGGEQFNSRLVYTFSAGEYRIVVASFFDGETGTYQLSAVPVGGSGSALMASRPRSDPSWLKVQKR